MLHRAVCAAVAVCALCCGQAKANQYDFLRSQTYYEQAWHRVYHIHHVRRKEHRHWIRKATVKHHDQHQASHKKNVQHVVQTSARQAYASVDPNPKIRQLEAVLTKAEAVLNTTKVIVIRPWHIVGNLRIAGAVFRFVSGGAGPSIPLGTHRITPHDVGRWGSRHGALGLDGNEMHDPQIGRRRYGIELHQYYSRTEGCVGIEQWADAKKRILAMIREFGHAFLNVGPHSASITPEPMPEFVGRVVMASHRSSRPRHHRYAHARHRHYRHFARA